MSARPTEIKALAKMLVSEVEHDSVEDMAKALINELDQIRRDRLDYIAIMQFGSPGSHITVAIGPYVSMKAAEKAVKAHPAASMASVVLVCSLQSPEGVVAALEALDKEPEPPKLNKKAREELDRSFWRKVREIDDKERTAIVADKGGVKIVNVQRIKP